MEMNYLKISSCIVKLLLPIYFMISIVSTRNIFLHLFFCFLTVIIAFDCYVRNRKIVINKSYIILFPIILMYFVTSLFFAEHSQLYVLASFLIVFILEIFYKPEYISNDKIYNYVSSIGIITLLIYKINTYNSSFNNEGLDLNFVSVMIFIFFMYCEKTGNIIGVLFAILYLIFINNSRSFFLMFIVFILMKLFKNYIWGLMTWLNIKTGKLFLISFLITILFSYFWVFNVSMNNLADYRESLNDGSNRMRFVSNIFFYDTALSNEITIYGYGQDIKDVLGLNEEDYSLNTQYLGVRLVQPHNSINNILLKMGIIPGILYLYFVSKLINKQLCIHNIEYIIPYFINAMIMHSCLNSILLELWYLLLLVPQSRTFRLALNEKR